MQKIISRNPSNNYQVIDEVTITTNSEIKEAVEKAHKTKETWKELGIKERIRWVHKMYQAYKINADEIASIITKEVGTAKTECKDEIAWDWGYFEWFLNNAEKILKPETTYEDKTMISQVYYEPLGVAAVITPWNLPFDLFLWGVIPNLLVGNTVVYKAAEECILTGKLLEKIAETIRLPEGVLSFIHGDARQGEFLVNQNIDLIWFTGSTEIGKKLYKIAGEKKIKAVLEMGGSNPAVIFDDADIEEALTPIIYKRYMFSGQTCDAIKRLIVHEKIFDKMIKILKKKVEEIKVGDPQDPKINMGPLVSEKQQQLLISQVDDAVKNGAKIIIGGKIPNNYKGAFYLPTILTNIKTEMRVWKEEVFGPVLPVMKFKTFDQAVELANDTRYGLTAQVYTKDSNKAQMFVNKVKAGSVDINGVSHFKPSNPFGGSKDSGIGREHGKYGFHELCELKLISRKK